MHYGSIVENGASITFAGMTTKKGIFSIIKARSLYKPTGFFVSTINHK